MKAKARYDAIFSRIFRDKHRDDADGFEFTREDIVRASKALRIALPKNIGDVIYSFRYRKELPDDIQKKAPAGQQWIIRPVGTALYRFALVSEARIVPSDFRAATKIPDSTPGVVARYAFNDEQALLSKIRYNRLIDVFTGLACYSAQNHMRTTVRGMGQIETDELYIGVSRTGAHFAIPVQAKGKTDQLSVVQIEQDFAMCREKLPELVCRPIGAQFLKNGAIVLFEFQQSDDRVAPCSEEHYLLVPPGDVSDADLRNYRARLGVA